MKYKRVLIKISGEALAGEKHTGFDFDFVQSVCSVVKSCIEEGTQVGIVIGGGNFWRGVKDGAGHVERVSADRMGMLATCMNCLAVADVSARWGRAHPFRPLLTFRESARDTTLSRASS